MWVEVSDHRELPFPFEVGRQLDGLGEANINHGDTMDKSLKVTVDRGIPLVQRQSNNILVSVCGLRDRGLCF